MRFKWLSEYWQGVIFGLGAIVASLWLGATGKLPLYIHPRYEIFTVVMCMVALAILLLGFARQAHTKVWTGTSSAGLVIGIVCLCLVATLLVTKPTALTSATATQRGINTAALDLSTQTDSATQLPSGDYSRFSIKEWASLLSQAGDPAFFERKKANLVGFVSPADNNSDVFYLSRFVVTCCAVDARPIGIPVYMPEWKSTYRADQWLSVEGAFTQKPDQPSHPIVLEPTSITPTIQPDDPYDH